MTSDSGVIFHQAVATIRRMYQSALAQERVQAEVALIRLENEYDKSGTIDLNALQALEAALERASDSRYTRLKAHLEQLKLLHQVVT